VRQANDIDRRTIEELTIISGETSKPSSSISTVAGFFSLLAFIGSLVTGSLLIWVYYKES
jgi:hypothetical protein